MTQHFLTPKNPDTANVVTIGHDRMLNTFFAQVYKDSGDDDQTWVLWEGCEYGQLPYPRSVLDLVRDHAHIPDELWDALADDKAFAAMRTSQQANAVTRWSATGRIEPERQINGANA